MQKMHVTVNNSEKRKCNAIYLKFSWFYFILVAIIFKFFKYVCRGFLELSWWFSVSNYTRTVPEMISQFYNRL